jgi:hypothetical protein
MHTWLVGICERLQNIRLVVWLVTARYAYPFIQWTHFTGLSLWLGTTLALDFRLLGAGKRFQTAAQLSDALFSWNWLGLGIAVLGGFTLFATAAVGYIDNPAFRLIFVQRKSRIWGRTPETPAVAKLAGLMEIVLWVSVGTAAVWIPNY